MNHFHVHLVTFRVKCLKVTDVTDKRLTFLCTQVSFLMPAQVLAIVALVRALITPEIHLY